MKFYRIQDDEGRGPFRPGFSKNWADGVEPFPTLMEDFGMKTLRSLNHPKEHYGTAVRDAIQLRRWFSQAEMERLKFWGFRIIGLEPSRIVAESACQVLFARRKPLNRDVLIIDWPKATDTAPIAASGRQSAGR